MGERGVQFRSLTEGFDTNTAGGEFLFHIMGALAQMERRMIVEPAPAQDWTPRELAAAPVVDAAASPRPNADNSSECATRAHP